MKLKCKILLVAGSAGSLPVIVEILNALPRNFKIPLIIVVHRQKNVLSEMDKLLSAYTPSKNIVEPDDKDPITENGIYLAPQNYHLLIEEDQTFSLDYSEAVLYSRPSIDVTFESAASVFKQHTCAVLLSGSNDDGAKGIEHILQNGGTAIVQDPNTAAYNKMPKAALNKNPTVYNFSPDKIVSFVSSL